MGNPRLASRRVRISAVWGFVVVCLFLSRRVYRMASLQSGRILLTNRFYSEFGEQNTFGYLVFFFLCISILLFLFFPQFLFLFKF